MESSGEGGVIFCDLPTVPAGPVGKFLVTQMAAVAELEAGLISQRTCAALAVAKRRGVRLGNPRPSPGTPERAAVAREARTRKAAARAADLRVAITGLRAEGAIPEGASLRAVALALEDHGVPAPRGGLMWSTSQVWRVLVAQRELRPTGRAEPPR